MVFDIYKIRSREIAAFVPYILFNRCLDPHYSATITSFANTNICLGIIQGKSLESTGEGIKFTRDRNGISSYLSGMYLSPHRFTASGTLDEICIDFTPLGYYQFLKLPARTYILNEDILSEAFGKEAISFLNAYLQKMICNEEEALLRNSWSAITVRLNPYFQNKFLT